MHDNAPIHASGSTRAWLQRHRIDVLSWPANSPDCNIMENVWGAMVRKIYSGNQHYANVKELKKAIVEAWHQVDQNLIDSLYASLNNRMLSLIRNNGGPIDY